MSEYQYYEFRTIGRQLTANERIEVDNLSSHGHTTATSFSVDYSWGDFKHDADDVLVRYFDAFFYIANWGTTTLKFRYPRELVNTRAWEPYCIEESMTIDLQTVGESVILTFEYNEEEGYGWIEEDGSLDGVIGLYDEILGGDHRALYLAWLAAIQHGTEFSYRKEFDNDTLEPPVPPGLGKLSAALKSFVELFTVPEDLIAVAAKGSETAKSAEQVDAASALAALTKEECIDFLRRLLREEAHLALKLKQRLGVLNTAAETKAADYQPAGKRTVSELLAARSEEQDRRAKASEVAREVARKARLKELAARGDSVWQDVEDLIEQKNTDAYKQAANLLAQLSELAQEQGQTSLFDRRVSSIRNQYSRRSALMRELRKQLG